MSKSLKRLAYLGPIIGLGIGGYQAYFFSYFKGQYQDMLGIAPLLGIIILIVSFVGLFGAWLLNIDRPIGGLFLLLSGVLSCLLILSIPAGLLELLVVVLLIKTNVADKRKISHEKSNG